MSTNAVAWALRYGPKDRAMRSVLVIIAESANRDGEHARPGLEAIMEGALYSRATTFRILDRLAAEGWIEVTEKSAPGRVTVYRIPGVADGSQNETRTGLTTRPERVSNGSHPETHPDPPRVPLESSLSSSPSDGEPSEARRLCDLLADLIELNGSKRPTVTEAWVTAADRLMRLDGRTPAQVESAIRWSQGDEFWRANVLSMPTLRKQYDRLRLAAQRSRRSSHLDDDGLTPAQRELLAYREQRGR